MTTTTANPPAADEEQADQFLRKALRAFYAVVLIMALIGSALGVWKWLGESRWWLLLAFALVAVYELGGVALNAFADRRRQLGERAVAARITGAGFAAGAVAIQITGHVSETTGDTTVLGWIFAGVSAAAYVVFLLVSAAARRDALRKLGKLAETPPAYGVHQWTRHPLLTARARRLAVATAEQRQVERITAREQGKPDVPTTPMLGRAASLAAAAEEIRTEKRTAAISRALGTRIKAAVDPTLATLAVNTYDLGKIANEIVDGADYAGLAGLLSAELTPDRIAGGFTNRRPWWRWWSRRSKTVQTAPETIRAVLETTQTPAPPVAPASQPALVAATEQAPAIDPPTPPAQRAPQTEETDVHPTRETAETDDETADQVADQVDDQPPVLPEIPPATLPHLAKVMQAHRAWHVGITLPGRHPEALTYSKIKIATGLTGQQTVADVRLTLLALCGTPEAAEAYVGEKTGAKLAAALV